MMYLRNRYGRMIRMNEIKLSRGQIHMVDFGNVDEYSGSLQRGRRPAIIVSNDTGCRFSPIISVIPLTTQKTKRNLPTHCIIKMDSQNRLLKDSIALTEQVVTVNRFQIGERTGELSPKDMQRVATCLGVSVGLSLAG